MRKSIGVLFLLSLLVAGSTMAQEKKPPADTLVIEAEGSYEAEPDVATLGFHVSVQDKEFRKAYDRAAQALQRIQGLADRNGIPKTDVAAGSFTVIPLYDSDDRKRRTRAYRVENHVTLTLRDFSKIGPFLDEAVQDEVTEFRELNYSLGDEEAAKQKAVTDAMRRAEARASAALSGNGRKVGSVRFVSLDVRKPEVLARLAGWAGDLYAVVQTVDVSNGSVGSSRARQLTSLPVLAPEKIRVTATVQCIFQIL